MPSQKHNVAAAIIDLLPTNCQLIYLDLHRLQPIVTFLTCIVLTFVFDLYLVYGLESELDVINFFIYFFNEFKFF